jgi:hypothetical protein
MPWRTPLLGAFAAGQGQSTTARWAPLLSLAVPCFMPQTCPKVRLGRREAADRSRGLPKRRSTSAREKNSSTEYWSSDMRCYGTRRHDWLT